MPEEFAFCGRCGYALGEDVETYGAVQGGDDPSDTSELKWADVKVLGAGIGSGLRSGPRKREPLAAARDMTIDLGKLDASKVNVFNALNDGFDDLDESIDLDDADDLGKIGQGRAGGYGELNDSFDNLDGLIEPVEIFKAGASSGENDLGVEESTAPSGSGLFVDPDFLDDLEDAALAAGGNAKDTDGAADEGEAEPADPDETIALEEPLDSAQPVKHAKPAEFSKHALRDERASGSHGRNASDTPDAFTISTPVLHQRPGSEETALDGVSILASAGGAAEPEVVSADAIAYLKKHRRGGRLIYVAIVAVLVVGAIVGFSIWNNIYRPYDIDEATFPDPAVRAAVLKVDIDGDGKLSRDEAASTVSLEIEKAESVSGIGMFSNLESLTATGSELRSIDLSGLAALKSLDVSGSALKAIDLSPCPQLEILKASGSQISELDTAPVPALESLDISGTKIASLDVSLNSVLASLACDDRVTVSGIEATGLAQYWIVTSYSATSQDISGEVNTTRVSPTYDEDNKIAEIAYMDSENTGFARYYYDEEGRLTGMSYGLGAEESGNWTLSYNDAGYLSAAANAVTGASYEYAFDESGRIVAYTAVDPELYGATRHADFAYDDAGRLVRVEGDGAASLAYDDAGRLTSLATDDGSYVCNFTYDQEGRCVAATRPGRYHDVEETFFYDDAGRLAGAARNAGYSREYEDVQSSTFSCDSNGNITTASIIDTDDAADTCTITYRRVFATPANAPVGITPLLGDPLQYCLASVWAWQPWAISAPSEENDEAFVTVFNPTQTLLQKSLGLRVIPKAVQPAETPAEDGQAAPAEGETAAPPAEGEAVQPQEDYQYEEPQEDYSSYDESYDYGGYEETYDEGNQ